MSQASKKTSDPDKLDLILGQLKALGPMQEKLDAMLTAISTVREEVKSLQFDVANNSDRITALEKEMISVRVNDNAQQQHLRSLTLRLLNLPYTPGETDDNNSGLRNTVYDRVLKPILAAAKSNKDISTLPQLSNVIEACFRARTATQPSSSQPAHHPPVIIKLAARPLKAAIMKHRKHLPPLSDSEKSPGVQRLILVEDLTPANHKVLTALSAKKETAKVWSVDGTVKFTLVGNTTVHSVRNVFLPIEKILSA